MSALTMELDFSQLESLVKQAFTKFQSLSFEQQVYQVFEVLRKTPVFYILATGLGFLVFMLFLKL